ncbi:MAG: tyrosinase family protein [Acidobacteriota bacterium]
MARIRKNVWKLKSTDKTLVLYERAVTAMQQKPIADSGSWRFQGAIHEYRRQFDPLATSTDVLPRAADQKKFWNQCQHGSWYFLSWHRMYLHHFESIVAAEVKKIDPSVDWTLPYWNYSDDADPNARLLPPTFRSAKKADGTANALFVGSRTPACNAGQPFADDADVAIAGPLREPDFVSLAFGTGFGGPQTTFMHGGQLIGSLEVSPHGNMHMAIGGLMQQFFTAALDPIFWLHHANIDRLWQVWLDRDRTHTNPASVWPTAVRFYFIDAAGARIKMSSRQVIDTTAVPLSYTYDDTSDPLSAVPTIIHTPRAAVMTKKKTPPELVGATRKSFTLDTPVVHARFAAKPRPTSRSAAVAGAGPRRVFLNIEKLVSKEPAPSYDVYLNVPEGQDPKDNPHLFVGRLPMFGLVEASTRGAGSTGNGLQYALDITNLYAHVSALPGWDPNDLRVSFVPARGGAPTNVTVGRVSLYFA